MFRPKRGSHPAVEDENDPLIAIVQKLKQDTLLKFIRGKNLQLQGYKMDVSHPTHRFVRSVSFGLQTPEQIRALSVKAITNPVIFDGLNHPVKGGLYDPALGPIDRDGKCGTCGLGSFQCPGHFGHVELPVPVFCPMTFGQMFSVLRNACLYCHRLRMSSLKVLSPLIVFLLSIC